MLRPSRPIRTFIQEQQKGSRWGDLMMIVENTTDVVNTGVSNQITSAIDEGMKELGDFLESLDLDMREIPILDDIQAGMALAVSVGNPINNPMHVDCEFMMNIITWNCRGAAKKHFKSTFSRFCRKNDVGLAAILEPRVSGRKAINIIRRLGFSNHLIADAHGFTGGIWILWNNSDVKVNLITRHEQFMHCWVEFPDVRGFYWTNVYASPQEDTRIVLWEELKHIGRVMNNPWLITGDFNEIAMASEKRGGGPVDMNRCNRFVDVLNACRVMDLGGGGNRFTWKGPKFLHLDRVYKRLDRAVGNEECRASLENADIVVLPRLFYDHCPILDTQILTGKTLQISGYLAVRCQEWNRNVFWFIHHRKNRVFARLEGIQNQMSSSNSQHLEKLEAVLNRELADILDQEEQIWFQKSRGDWIIDGDRNTRYYHTSTVVRRKKNKSEEIVWFHTSNTWPVLQGEQHGNLSMKLSVEEVKRAFFQMPALKAPGVNGYPALFFQRNWEILQEQVFSSMQFFMQNPSQIGNINHTLIVLIPKVKRPCLMKQSRTIALCNTIYKGLSKILANRIKPLLMEIISPNQASFVPKRNIQDNIIIVQELIHSMHRMKGKKSFLSIKIDLEKAYDKLSWSFIRSVLEDLKFPGDLVEAIMGCVSSPVLEVLWNGARTPSFHSQRGIRQGDPLSPYLFVLSSLSQLNCITQCLEKFSRMSGQSVSIEKSCIYYSKNTPQDVRRAITDASGFKKVENLGRYLGSMMRHVRIKKDHYAEVISRIQNKLQGWKSRCLSLAGRITLAKSGDTETKRRAHYVSWEIMCQPKECSGLGIIDLRIQNEAFIQKLAWNLISGQDSLWVRVLIGKYGRNHDPYQSLNAKPCDSSLWKNICLAHSKISHHSEWVVMDGKSVNFWLDRWGGWQNPLFDLASFKPPMSDLEYNVWDLVDPNTDDWNWENLNQFLDAASCIRLSNIPPPKPGNLGDWLNWKVINPEKSIVKNAYNYLLRSQPVKDSIWAAIWKWRAHLELQFFCVAKNIWGRWFGGSIPVAFLSTNGREWIRVNLFKPFKSQLWKSWKENYFVTCWYLWQWRNPIIHDSDFARPQDPIKKILQFLTGVKRNGNANPFAPGAEIAVLIRKACLGVAPIDTMLFVDGAVQQSDNSGACGGVVCSSKGSWISGFSYYIGPCSPLEAELRGILHGLKLAASLAITRIWIDCDSKEAILCLETDTGACGLASLIDLIKTTAAGFDQVRVDFIPREENEVADSLAKLGLSYKGGELRIFSSPPVSTVPFWDLFCFNLLVDHMSIDLKQLSL
ncbi:uncharacterized protein LOC133287003 [Gastrolobium bilobum]|uniref:uncharacterized protein LOC133287003 n=1 Tax=Gastrolobium bilobum TaxID=150636 RepID=UPI002AB1F58B|nr:uncharacterized protein LOC133287003 [Gastrolobium bilobum]